MPRLRLFLRFLFFVSWTAWTVARIWLRSLVFGPDRVHAMAVRRQWARRLLDGVGVRVTVEGEAPAGACIVVSNHRSYLDPVLVLRDLPVFPVAKAELADWPLIGRGAQHAGILYLKREHAGSRSSTLRAVADVTTQGYPVLIYPEGTTSGLVHGTLPFKKGIFQLAARLQLPVVPVALRFADPRDFWIGHDTFFGHVRRRFVERHIDVAVYYGPALRSDDGEYLRAEAQAWIENALSQIPQSAIH
jgi:1-acyl-sn-glycerol-3-phosphate acyltransferase